MLATETLLWRSVVELLLYLGMRYPVTLHSRVESIDRLRWHSCVRRVCTDHIVDLALGLRWLHARHVVHGGPALHSSVCTRLAGQHECYAVGLAHLVVAVSEPAL